MGVGVSNILARPIFLADTKRLNSFFLQEQSLVQFGIELLVIFWIMNLFDTRLLAIVIDLIILTTDSNFCLFAEFTYITGTFYRFSLQPNKN